MVVDCPKCGEHAYATRFKDSPMSVCRNCRYYKDTITGEEGYDEEREILDSPIDPYSTEADHERWPRD